MLLLLNTHTVSGIESCFFLVISKMVLSSFLWGFFTFNSVKTIYTEDAASSRGGMKTQACWVLMASFSWQNKQRGNINVFFFVLS